MFWDRFVDVCKEKGKKPTPVVTACGFSSGLVSAWKNGAKPSAEKVQKIASYLNVSVDYLLGGESTPDNLIAVKMSVEDLKLLNTIKLLDEQSLAQLSDYINYLLSKR